MKFDNLLIIFLFILGIAIGLFCGNGFAKFDMRNQVIEQGTGQWVIDPSTGKKSFNSPYKILNFNE